MSETTNLKLFKHDNPSTNTNPFDVEQALNDNWNKIDTAVGDLQDDIKENNTNITNIDTRLTTAETDLETAKTDITNIKAEQTTQNNNIEANSTAIETNVEAIEQNKEDIQSLQEENSNLKAQIPTGTAAGEEISLSDSAEMELVDFGLQGNSKQNTREGYNLLPPFESTVLNGITYTKNADGTVIANGTASADSFYRQNINLEEGDYYLSGSPTGGANNTYYLQAMGYGEAGNDYGSGTTFKVTSSSSVGIRIMIYQGVTVNNLVFKPMLTKGTEKKEYEQYGVSPSLDYKSEVEAVGDSGSVEIISSNKNLLSFEYRAGNGITFDKNRITIIDPSGYLYAGKTLVGGNSSLSGKKVIFTTISNGTISNGTISGTLDFTVHTNKVRYRFQKKHTAGTYNNDIKSEGVMFANDEYITSIFVYTTGATSNLTIDVQVEIADEATEFVEHKGNTYTIPVQKPFYKIGNYADRFIKQDDKWYEQHYVKKLIFTGNEDIKQSTEVNRFYIVDTSLAKMLTDESTINCLCNYFKGTSYYNRWTADCTSAREYTVTFCTKENYTSEEFKAKLQELYNAGTPVKVYYILATPELIECTPEQTQILEQIIKDGTYKEVTHFYTAEDLKPTIEIKYYKDLETLFKNQASIQATLNNVQAQILELGGN